MLNELTIENVAVIEKADIRFTPGFNVLTGETGAGKSILIDSINAILGNRTSRELVRTGAEKSIIWAKFTQIGENTKQALQAAGYNAEDELLLYREITAEGKSNCRVNGLPATASIVRDICDGLIDIHGQHDSADLSNPARHLNMLDAFAQNLDLHTQYYKIYRELCAIQRQIKSLSTAEKDKTSRIEILQYNIAEIESADLCIGEEENLQQEREKARNSEKIISSLQNAYNMLSGNDDVNGAEVLLGSAVSSISQISELSTQYAEYEEKLNDLYYNAKDIAEEINKVIIGFENDIPILSQIEERLDIIYKLKLKYGSNIEEILEQMNLQKQELNDIQMSDEKLLQLRNEQKNLYTNAKTLAEELTQSRLAAFERMKTEITKTLEFLNMANINFVLSHTKGSLAGSGQDSVEFYLSANKGEEPRPLSKIASGGELSRIMLAIKSSLAEKDNVGVQIYDEIDTGVSGLASGRIGKKLKDTSIGRQIICITHTAQIASYADTHLLIEKMVQSDRTYTKVRMLNTDERVRELARITQGDNITELALAGAAEMLRCNSNA